MERLWRERVYFAHLGRFLGGARVRVCGSVCVRACVRVCVRVYRKLAAVGFVISVSSSKGGLFRAFLCDDGSRAF